MIHRNWNCFEIWGQKTVVFPLIAYLVCPLFSLFSLADTATNEPSAAT